VNGAEATVKSSAPEISFMVFITMMLLASISTVDLSHLVPIPEPHDFSDPRETFVEKMLRMLRLSGSPNELLRKGLPRRISLARGISEVGQSFHHFGRS